MMEFFSHFHFLRPLFLLAIPIAAFILWRQYARREQGADLLDLCDPHLLPAVIDSQGGSGNLLNTKRIAITLFALLTLLSAGLAGPTWDKKPVPLLEPQNARVVVWGLAPSMAKTDLAPSRFARAQFKAMDLIRSSPSLLQALVIYSGDAFVVSPLSDDHNTILNLLKAVAMDTLPTTGNRADKGLERAALLLDQPSIAYKEVVLVTDSASPLALSTAQQLSANNINVSVLSVNKADASNTQVLKAIAKTGNGTYTNLQLNNDDIDALNAKLQRAAALSLNIQRRSQNQFGAQEYKDNGVWLLLVVLATSSLLFRRGWLMCLALLPLGLIPHPAYALKWQDLWQRQEQQAAQQYHTGAFKEVLTKSAPHWQAVAAYRSDDFEAASAYLEGLKEPNSYYNRGNAYAKQGNFEEALAAYNKVLEEDSKFSDAEHNRQIVEKILEQQQNSEQQQSEDSDQQKGEQEQENQGENTDSSEQQEVSDQNQQSKGQQQGESEQSDESDQDTQSKEQQLSEASDNEEEQEPDEQQTVQAQAEQIKSEDQQALEQWLRKLPDNPGALLKRKFKVQHQRRWQSNSQ